jgi:hypothetical protein
VTTRGKLCTILQKHADGFNNASALRRNDHNVDPVTVSEDYVGEFAIRGAKFYQLAESRLRRH